MLQAVEAPLLKMAAVAGAALLVSAFVAPHHKDHAVVQRLSLHAPEEPNALYLTAWSDGDVFVTLHDGKARSLTFQTRAFINDGCEWLATEQLIPTGDDRYSYSYDEEILSCEPNAVPARKTPRTGYVSVESVR
ncbi:MAG TPA: hypothetical protein VLB44_16405 [Kofleriaceae bacterium]|nr:hypothetical protein [Kofleriaceae bacterium]